MNFNEKTILVKLTILLCVLCDLVMSKVSRALIGWPRSRDPEAASDWSESRNVEWLNPLDMTSDYCIIRINEIHSTARLPHSGLASGQEGWARWARRKYRVSGGDPWVIVIMWGEWEHGLCRDQETRCCDGSKISESETVTNDQHQGSLLMSEPIHTNIYSLYHWQFLDYWIYGHGKNLLCFEIMTHPPGAELSGVWSLNYSAWKTVFVTCL